MFKNKVIPLDTKQDLYWIIKPIIFWMKIIGVNLKNDDGLHRQPVLAILYTLLWLTFDVFLFVATINASLQDSFRLPDTASPVNFTSTVSWTAIIYDFNYNSKFFIYVQFLKNT